MLREAEELGVVQINLTGGEPLVRDDLEELVEEAPRARPLHEPDHQRHSARAASGSQRLRELGLDNVQLRSRTRPRAASDRIAGLRVVRRAKLRGRGAG